MRNKKITIDLPLKADFFDVDSMRIVWHGNYVKYYEQARCALLDLIGYNYNEMEKSGYAWPVVKLEIKYLRSIVFTQEFYIRATITEYEHRLKIDYIIFSKDYKEILNKGQTIQMAVDMKTGSTMFVSPTELIEKVKNYLDKTEVDE